MLRSLRPVAFVSDAALAAGKRSLVWNAAWVSITGAWSGGVLLVAFALYLGVGPLTIGLLAAIPFIAQAAHRGAGIGARLRDQLLVPPAAAASNLGASGS
jgi:hypothetical protein